MKRTRFVYLLCVLICLGPLILAQGKLDDYDRANGLRDRIQGLAVNIPERVSWIEKSNRFWYRKAVRGGNEFVLVDATTAAKKPVFDHERLAAALAQAAGAKYTALTLPFSTFSFTDGERAIQFTVGEARWRCDLDGYSCQRETTPAGPGARGGGPPSGRGPQAEPADQPKASPDGAWEALIQNYNVFLRPKGKRDSVPLSFDGSEDNYYTLASITWSPDSKKLAAYRVHPGYHRKIQYVESSPADQVQPKYSVREYPKPGDTLDIQQPVVFHVESKKQFNVDNALFPNAYAMTRPVWWKDSRALSFEYNQRGHQAYRIIEVDGTTGKARAMVNEEVKTFFCYYSKKYRYDAGDGKELIWMSERDGWNHLYLYDGATAKVKNQITKGNWVVRGVEKVDEEKRQIWFRASGMHPGKDPYFLHYFRINFDGTGLTALTEADGNHTVSFSPDMQYYTDSCSRVDMAPVLELRTASDQKKIAELERGDVTDLLKTGLQLPEVFASTARDGKTDIWGIILRPMNFDPAKKYPVIEYIYAGPHDSFVPKNFSAYSSMQSLAELGFIVSQIDGMGTSNRSKAFHDVCWKNLADAGFPDRILWHQAVAAKYPYYDITRVGIYGHSAGGQNAMGALLFHPEFYDAAVSSCGCHDNRMDKISWNEQWMGWPIGPEYAACSNVDNAYRLQGKLLLSVGEMDTNVDPASTMQVVNALIKANKTFEFIVLPGAGHSSGGAYGDRKRYDFFVRHLLGVEPPDWNQVPPKSEAIIR